jgi:hypothetical protein
MAYYGRVRAIRLARAARRFEYPIWRHFVHPRLLKIELLRSVYPQIKTWVLPDERAN